MTDSNIQPPDSTQVPGTDVTNTTPAGLYPEGTVPPTDGTYNVPPTTTDQDYITTGTAADTYTVPPTGDYAGAVDYHVDNMPHAHASDPEILQKLDHVLEHLHQVDAKIESLHQRLDQDQMNDHGPEVPPTYEGHVVLHATYVPPQG